MRDPRLLPYRLSLKRSARSLRRDPTPAERKLWYEFLAALPFKFTRQKPLGSYIADFYCSSKRLVVEVDGDSHFTTRGEAYDRTRTASLEAKGLRVLRFTNPEVLEQFESVCQGILEALKA
jgi:very-short-patch-repair endonuclease